jgi:membrane protein DedA with SNARE-associated domain
MLNLTPDLLVITPLSPDEIAIAVTAFLAQSLKEWGIPSPGVTQGALVFAGYKIASGDPYIGIVIAMATLLGFVTGSTSLYLISRSTGNFFSKHLNRLFRLNPNLLERLKNRLITAHWLAVMMARFIPTLMAPLTIVAGLVKFPLLRFYITTGLAMLVWLTFFGGIGLIWGNTATDFIAPSYLPWFSALLALGLLGGSVFWLIRQTKTGETTVDG